jgi:hypothetical protein
MRVNAGYIAYRKPRFTHKPILRFASFSRKREKGAKGSREFVRNPQLSKGARA